MFLFYTDISAISVTLRNSARNTVASLKTSWQIYHFDRKGNIRMYYKWYLDIWGTGTPKENSFDKIELNWLKLNSSNIATICNINRQHGAPSSQLKRYLARMEKEGLVRVSESSFIWQKHHFEMMIYSTAGEDALNHHGLLPDLLGSPLRGDRLALELGMGGGQEVPCTWGWCWCCSDFVLQRFERNTFPCLWCASNTVDISLIPRSASTYPTFTPLSIPRSTW